MTWYDVDAELEASLKAEIAGDLQYTGTSKRLEALTQRDKRPLNTKKSYKRAETEFVAFVMAHPTISLEHMPTRVSPERLFAWVDESLCVRGLSKGKAEAQPSPASIRHMINGVVDFWCFQRDVTQRNSGPHPFLGNGQLTARLE